MLDTALALPGSAATNVAWRVRGQLHITVIAKATFAFAPDAPMSRTEPQETLRAEVHHGKDPGRSVRFTTDLAPALARADVIFTGSAHVPPGAPVTSLPVRLAVFAEQRTLLDKRLLVQDPAGLTRAPLVYERTGLGLDERENPFGLTSAGGVASVIDPAQPGRPAGFGPLGRAWPARKRLLGAVPRRVLEAPIAEVPEGFDWSYFQAAPLDQRTPLLRGDEWIILEGLHPSHPRFRTRLPGARGMARVHGLSGFGVPEGQILELQADTLRIDGDAQQCTVVWRRSFPVASEAALAAVRVVAGVSVGGEVLAWVEPPKVQQAPQRSVVQVDPALSDSAVVSPGTIALDPAEIAAADVLSALPFFAGTVAFDPEQMDAGAVAPALPFQAAIPGQSALAQSAPRSQSEPLGGQFTGTVALSSEDDFLASGGGATPVVMPSFMAPVPAAPPVRIPEPRYPPPVLEPEAAVAVPVALPEAPLAKRLPAVSVAVAERRGGEAAERVVLSFSSVRSVAAGSPVPGSAGEHFLAAMARAGEQIELA